MNLKSQYTWLIGDGPQKGESAWSIVHKFCYRNAVGIAALIPHLNASSENQTIPFTCKMDLRFKKTVITQSILKLVNSSIHEEETDTLEYLTGVQDIRHLSIVSADYLRYCEICIARGYHATINQLLFRKTCHIHPHVDLKEGCCKCNSRMPYEPPSSAKAAYACPFCLTSLLGQAENVTNVQQNVLQNVISKFTYSTPISSSFFGFANAAYVSVDQLYEFMDNAEMFLNYKHNDTAGALKNSFVINTSIIQDSKYQVNDISSGYGKIFKSLLNQIEERYLGVFYSTRLPINSEECATLYALNQWCHYWGGVTRNWQSLNLSNTQYDNLDKAVFNRFIAKYQVIALSQFPEAFRQNLFRKIFSVMCESSFRMFLRECQAAYPSCKQHVNSLPILTNKNDGAVFFTVESSDTDFLCIHFFQPKECGDVRPFLSL